MGAWTSKSEGEGAPADGTGGKRGLKRYSWKLRLLVGLPLTALLVATIAISTALIYYTIRFPDPMALRKRDAAPIVRVLDRQGQTLVERGQGASFIPLDLIPRHLIDAVVATEDRRFYDHYGVDPMGLVRAMFANLRAGRYAQGGSTLTQQLAKNLFLSSERTMGRKLEEFLLSIWLEARLSKHDILELYLNRVYFGGGAYGVEAASRRYFDKGARQVTLAEAAVLAGLLKAPSKYSPAASPGLARSRARSVLRKMQDAKFIDEEAEQAAVRSSVKFADATAGRETSGLEYAIEFVLERLPQLSGTGQREVIVETTFDASLQKHAQAVVERTLATQGGDAGASQAAVLIVDTDGGIRAMVGGRSFAQSQYNRATKAQRQPGSAFKPLVYLTAIEQGATPETTVLDLPLNIGGWSPRNFDGQQSRGPITLRQALAHSVNTVAVRLQQDSGTRRVIAAARRLGIKSELRADPSLALGTSEVTLLELTGAYAVLASGGLGVEAHAIRRVRTSNGTVLYARPQTRPRMVVAPDHVGAMSSMLNTALVSGTGRRAALPRFPAAGKTGTTQDFRDAWFVGYTAHLAGGVWVGNDGGEPMNKVTGGSLSAGIWRDVMQQAHAKLQPAALPGVDEQRRDSPAAPLAPAATATPPPRGDDPIARLIPSQPAAPAAAAPGSLASARAQVARVRSDAFTPAAPRRPFAPAARTTTSKPKSPPPVAATAPAAPKEQIDPGAIARALAPPAPTKEPAALDKDALQRTISSDGRMGLGVKP